MGNSVGTDPSGAVITSNRGYGIRILGAEHSIVQGNLIAYTAFFDPGNAGIGVYVGSSAYNTIRRNSIYSNEGQGILLDGGNYLLPAPVILTVTETTVSGTACPGCTVEVFSDDEDEGRVYEGSTVANGAGAFTFTRPTGLTGPYITATATDHDGNTSDFSTPQRAWQRIYLSLILKGW
jgi:parallel beta-helix repeat protein